MRWFLYFLIVTVVVVLLIPISRNYIVAQLFVSPCNTPLTYKIGSIDPRFGLSETQVSDDILEATSIWSAAEGKNLFIEDPNSHMTVNFIYDQRQQLDTQIQNLQSQLTNKNQTLQQQISSYYQQSAQLKQQIAQLNAEIESWNAKGGAPNNVYNQIILQQKDLQQKANQLNQTATQLNLSTNDYNSQVQNLNQDVSQFNTVISQKPEEGLYDPNNDTITIYFADNHDELIHTLTHEFGHYLGMGHVHNDPEAIMYPYTTSYLKVTPGDMAELNYVCRKQDILVVWFNKFSLDVHQYIQNLQNQVSTTN